MTLVTEGEVGEATVYRERSGPGFMKSKSDWTIRTFDPPAKLVHVSKEMAAEATWTLDELDDSTTRVAQALDFEMMPRFRPLGRLLEVAFATRITQRETERMLQDVKRLAEAGASGSQ